MIHQIKQSDLPKKLWNLIDAALRGEPVFIERDGKALVQLFPQRKNSRLLKNSKIRKYLNPTSDYLNEKKLTATTILNLNYKRYLFKISSLFKLAQSKAFFSIIKPSAISVRRSVTATMQYHKASCLNKFSASLPSSLNLGSTNILFVSQDITFSSRVCNSSILSTIKLSAAKINERKMKVTIVFYSFPKKMQSLYATTNLEGSIDKALFRRFDDFIEFPRPGKDEIVQFQSRKDTVYVILAGIFITNAIVAELIGGKLIYVFGVPMSIGILPWPIVFITTDLINE